MSPRRMELKFITPISKDEIPARSHRSALSELPLWDEMERVCAYAKENGSVPFEEAATIDISTFPQLKKMKKPVLAVLARLRLMLKKHKVAGKLELQRRGDKIYLIGA